jgi:ArsR family transcriptional regulator
MGNNNGKLSVNEMVFKLKADFLRSLAHPARLAIIEYLKRGEASVGQMVTDLGIEQSGLSKHLATLRQAGILASRQEKVSVYYAIKDKEIFDVLRPIAEILKRKLKESEDMLTSLGRM